MIRVLVVEDGGEKRTALARVLARIDGFDMGRVVYVDDLATARREIKEHLFDLVVLDIALPPRIGQEVQARAGIELLEEVLERPDRFKVPAHILGITAYPEIYQDTLSRFSSRLLTLLLFDPGSSDWEIAVQARVSHVLQAVQAKTAAEPEYGALLGVVCALDMPELTSIIGLSTWNMSQLRRVNDHIIYWRGSVPGAEGLSGVYAAASDRMGMTAAAIVATKLVERFRPRYLAMTGIAAGVPGRVELGDVVVADPCWDWGSGKWTTDAGQPRFRTAPHQLTLTPSLRSNFRMMTQDAGTLAEIRSEWPADKPSTALSLHVGPMASGASVLADRETADRLMEQHRGLLAFEMEAYGIYAAGEGASEPRPDVFVMKSVVDFADEVKDDRFRAYGAFVSAKALQRFVERYLAT